MFFCKSEKGSLWRKIIERKLVFKKKCLNHSITLLLQSSDKRDAQLFLYFGYEKSIEKFQIYQKKRAFHLHKAHYLKPFIGSSVYKDQELQCAEECKYTSNQVRIFKMFFKVNLWGCFIIKYGLLNQI